MNQLHKALIAYATTKFRTKQYREFKPSNAYSIKHSTSIPKARKDPDEDITMIFKAVLTMFAILVFITIFVISVY